MRMRKVVVVLIALAIMSIGTAVMAQEAKKVTGTVTKIDTAALSLTIQPQDGATVTIIMKDAESLSKIKEGEKGEVRYTVKDGKNTGTRIRKIEEGGCSG